MLTPLQAAKRANVSLSMIYALLRAGRLPGYRVGCRGKGKWLIREEDLDGFLASCKLNDLPQDDGTYKHLR